MKNPNTIKTTLVFATILGILLIVLPFTHNLWFMNNALYEYAFWLAILVHYSLLFIILRIIWKDTNKEKNKKVNNTILVIFLGIVGMWIWLIKEKK